MKTVQTSQGEFVLDDPSKEFIETFYRLLPYGLMQVNTPSDGALFGLVMKQGLTEVEFIKFQPPDCDEALAHRWQFSNSMLIAQAVAELRDQGTDGLILPVTYFRTKAGGRHESGIAVLTMPKDGTQPPMLENRGMSFFNALGKVSKSTGRPLETIIGVEPRPRLQLESVAFSFALVGGQMVCLRRTVSHEDPVWELLCGLGIHKLPHMPVVPLEK